MKGIRLRGVLVLVALVLPGCYAYRPVSLDAVRTGQEVRLDLTADEGRRLGELVGQGTAPRRMRGRVEAPPFRDTLVLGALFGAEEGAGPRRLSRSLPVALVGIEAVEVSELSRGRTAALLGIGLAVAAAVVESQMGVGEGEKGNDDPGGVDEILIPLFFLRW